MTTSGKSFRLRVRVARPAAEVLVALRDRRCWERALGGTWGAGHTQWSFGVPRPETLNVAWTEPAHGVEVRFTGRAGESRAELSAVDDGAGDCTIVADVQLGLVDVIPGAWWVELEHQVLPAWLKALTAPAPAETGRAEG